MKRVNHISKRSTSTFPNLMFKLLVAFKLPFYKKKLLIVRPDAIGDYVLFRNCLPEIRSEGKFAGYKIVLLGNIVFKDLAEAYDSSFIDEFIWINPNEVNTIGARFKLLLKLKLHFFEIIINPLHSHYLEYDIFLSQVKAKILIGSKGDDVRLKTGENQQLSNSLYTYLVEVPGTEEFEFFRNIAFMGNLLNRSVRNVSLSLKGSKICDLQEDCLKIIIVPGAGDKFRRWSPENFAVLIKDIDSNLHKKIRFIITGSQSERIIADQIKKHVGKHNVISLCGEITLVELVDIIAGAKLLISNETGTVHIAAAVGTPAVCISNGNHFGRFNPYPEVLSKCIYTVYPDESFYDKNNYDTCVKKYKYGSAIDINTITPDKVFQLASSLLS